MTNNGIVVSDKQQRSLQIAMSLPDFRSVALPECYQRARQALIRCERLEDVQEFRTYAQKAAFYAKLIQNGELMELARKVDARAWRQMGDMLKKLPESSSGPNSKGTKQGGVPREQTRRGLAEAAGIQPKAQTKAMKIASITDETFNTVVDQPGSVSAAGLIKIADAESGTPKRTHMMGNDALRRVAKKAFENLRDFVNHHEPETIASLFGSERDSICAAAVAYREWFGRFAKAAQKDDSK